MISNVLSVAKHYFSSYYLRFISCNSSVAWCNQIIQFKMFKSLVTLVTGGTGCLGHGVASRFARKGAPVILSDLPSSNGAQIAKELGENVTFMPADVRSESDVRNLMSEIQKKYGQLNTVINCASVARIGETYNFQRKKPMNLDDFELVFGTRVLGTLNVNRLAIDLLTKNEPDANGIRGIIINTSGCDTITYAFGDVMNATSSAAIDGMTLPLAECLADVGIRVVTIAPGLIASTAPTELTKSIQYSLAEDIISAPQRYGVPDEFAHLVQMMAANPSINGTTIDMNGGLK